MHYLALLILFIYVATDVAAKTNLSIGLWWKFKNFSCHYPRDKRPACSRSFRQASTHQPREKSRATPCGPQGPPGLSHCLNLSLSFLGGGSAVGAGGLEWMFSTTLEMLVATSSCCPPAASAPNSRCRASNSCILSALLRSAETALPHEFFNPILRG